MIYPAKIINLGNVKRARLDYWQEITFCQKDNRISHFPLRIHPDKLLRLVYSYNPKDPFK